MGSKNKKSLIQLQYRKRYELLQLFHLHKTNTNALRSYNTASGMNCCNMEKFDLVNFKKGWLQYRKRYELLQQANIRTRAATFNWLQYRKRYELLQQKTLLHIMKI